MEHFNYFNWFILPLIIFCSRICDVSLGTLRHVFAVRGLKNITPVLGFFEVLIWIIVVKQVMNNANNWVCYIAWAGGFAAGNYVGLIIEEKLALGLQVVRIITSHDYSLLVENLSKANHGVTIVDAQGAKGPVKMIFTIVKRKNVNDVAKIIAHSHPSAFYSIEDIRDTSAGIFRKTKKSSLMKNLFPGK